MSSSYYMEASNQPPASTGMTPASVGWGEYMHQHHSHQQPYHHYYNPYFMMSHQQSQASTRPPQTSQPSHQPQQQQQPPPSESESENYDKSHTHQQPQQPQSEPSKSPQPPTMGYEHSDLSLRTTNGFNAAAAAEAAAEAAALQAAAIQAASTYDMYSNAVGQPPKANNMANSPSSFYPWMKNYNGKKYIYLSRKTPVAGW